MFGPNSSVSFKGKVDFHHREYKFFELYSELESVFRSKFSIANDYHILPITGSGTLAIESFIFSFLENFKVEGHDGEFKNRLTSLCKTHNKYSTNSKYILKSHLETSSSIVNDVNSAYFVDCVSSFPYYNFPNKAKAWVTVSSKVLGAAPIISFIVLSNDIKDMLIDADKLTYFNVKRMINFSEKRQTSHTPAIALFIDCLDKLKDFDINQCRNTIDKNCSMLEDAIGSEKFIGEKKCPVLTIPRNHMSEKVISEFQLYGAHTNPNYIQIFTYSESESAYEKLCSAIKKNH